MVASIGGFVMCADRWKRPLDQLLHATKSHLEEDPNDGVVMAVPDGFEFEPIIKTK